MLQTDLKDNILTKARKNKGKGRGSKRDRRIKHLDFMNKRLNPPDWVKSFWTEYAQAQIPEHDRVSALRVLTAWSQSQKLTPSLLKSLGGKRVLSMLKDQLRKMEPKRKRPQPGAAISQTAQEPTSSAVTRPPISRPHAPNSEFIKLYALNLSTKTEDEISSLLRDLKDWREASPDHMRASDLVLKRIYDLGCEKGPNFQSSIDQAGWFKWPETEIEGFNGDWTPVVEGWNGEGVLSLLRLSAKLS